MKNWLRRHITRDMIRPIIYKSSSRFLCTLTVALLWDRFVNQSPTGLAVAFVLLFILFLAGAWLARMRLDGWHIPSLPKTRFRLKEKADILYGDMIDHVDEDIISFDDLEEDEQNICLMLADGICALIFLAASFFV